MIGQLMLCKWGEIVIKIEIKIDLVQGHFHTFYFMSKMYENEMYEIMN